MFRNYPVEEADAAYSAMQKQFHDYLSTAGFPESLFEKVLAASSKDIRWLSREELRLIGPMPPYLQERFLAACSLEIDTPTAVEKTLDCLNQILKRSRVEFIDRVMGGKEDREWEIHRQLFLGK
jgi:hypothetical protein